MKNLKMFAIAVMAFAVMAMGVHAAGSNYNGLSCKEDAVSDKCTLTAAGTLTSDVDSDMTIVGTKDYTVTISSAVEIKRDSSLTIEGGRLILDGSAAITIGKGATLKVTKVPVDAVPANDFGAIRVNSTVSITADKGTLEVSDNEGKGIFVGSGNLTLTLSNHSKFILNNNKLNAMNGVGTSGLVKATDSEIEVKNNGLGGFNGKADLTDSKITATGNGYQGITFGGGSSIGEGSEVIANDNLKSYTGDDADKRADKADVLINGTLTVTGKLTADSMAPLKNGGTVLTATIELTEGGIVDVNTTKALCGGATIGGTCGDDAKSVTPEGDGLVIVGDTATVYGTEEIEVPADVKKVVIAEANNNVIVAPGTEVENKTSSKLFVKTTDGTVYEVGNGKTATLGVAAPTPEEQQPGTEGENPGNQGGTGNVPNPNTSDNILVYAGLGLVSLATVTFTTRKRED